MRRSLILDVVVQVVFHSALMLGLFLLFTGHHRPGGGFVGGLVVGAGLSLRYLSGGIDEVRRTVPFRPWTIQGTGLVLSASTTVVPLFLGQYLPSLAKNAADSQGSIHPLGIQISAVSLWPYMVSLAVLLQVLVLPLFGAIADHTHRKKELLGLLAFAGSAATIAMFALEGTRYMLGCVLFLIANSAFGASIVVYNSFLPEIASPE